MIGLALAVALIVGGTVTAFASRNALKKVVALLIAFVGAALVAAFVGAPQSALIASVAVAFGYCIVGVAVVVRLQEAYGSIETSELDAADEQDEPRESET